MRRVLAAIAAIILAIVGAILLLNYVEGADERAMEGLKTAEVLVVDELIPEGTAAEDVTGLVRLQTLPQVAVAPESLGDLADVDGLVTTTDLLPGEQVLTSRFADPATLAAPTRIETPQGFQEVTIQLEAQRVLGGMLKAGDLVGIILSATIEDNPNTDGVDESLDVTSNILDQVLVTRVALTDQATTEDGQRLPQSLYVTFAVDANQAEQIVFGMEHASVWLALQPEGPLAGTSVPVTGEVLLR